MLESAFPARACSAGIRRSRAAQSVQEAWLWPLTLPLSPFTGECHTAVRHAAEDLDLSRVLPLGRQHGILNSLELVLKNISHLIRAYLPRLLQMLLCVTAAAARALDQREKVGAMCTSWLGNPRRHAPSGCLLEGYCGGVGSGIFILLRRCSQELQAVLREVKCDPWVLPACASADWG